MTGRSPSGRATRPADQAAARLGDTASVPNAALACYDCGLPYAGEHWVEAVVPHDIWNKHLSPTGNEGGILCINCMAARAAAKGLTDIPVMLTAGPFVSREDTTPVATLPICPACDLPHRPDYICKAQATEAKKAAELARGLK